MSEPFSNTSLTVLAFYDPESSSWRTSRGCLLSAAPESLERLPAWGMTSNGVLYELQTPERLTAARDGSASLPTPTAQAAKHGSTPDIHANGYGSNLWDLPHLLPTPTSVDSKVFGPNVDWQLRLSNHAPHTASVLMNLPLNDGNESSDDQHPTQQTIEGCDPDSSSG